MLRAFVILVVLVAGGARAEPPQFGPYFSGQMLVAAPTVDDPNFAETVIYLADHDAEGAFGLIVNRPLGRGPAADFMVGLKMTPPDDVDPTIEIRLGLGGPVERDAGFVLHTNDYQTEGTAMIRGAVAVTASLKAVKDISRGKGPRRHLVILGYAGWGPGQLENEMRRGDWGIAPYDETIVFDAEDKTKWRRASDRIGIPM